MAATRDSLSVAVRQAPQGSKVNAYQVGHTRVVSACQVDGREVSLGQRSQEQRIHAGTSLAGQEIADLGDDGRWHQQFTAGSVQGSKQLDACLMVRIVGQGGGYPRPGIADDHFG
jgi:hypothetical protein